MSTTQSQSIPHTARPHISHPDSVYILPADEGERARLNSQHTTFKRVFDGKLVLAPVELKPGDRVLDCGTGTGIWLLELAEQVPPTVSLFGIDVSSALFPSTPSPNATFTALSTFSLPEEWKNSFALVHQRLLIGSLTKPQWPEVIKCLYETTKPGGYVQLGEPGPSYAGPATERWKSLLSKLCEHRGIWEDIYIHLPSLLTSAGFINVTAHERIVPMGKWAGKEAEQVKEDHVAFVKGVKTPVLDAGGFGVVSSEAEFDKLVEEVAREPDETVGAGVRWFIFCAQKPGDSDT